MKINWLKLNIHVCHILFLIAVVFLTINFIIILILTNIYIFSLLDYIYCILSLPFSIFMGAVCFPHFIMLFDRILMKYKYHLSELKKAPLL